MGHPHRPPGSDPARPGPVMPDAVLINAARDGDEAAFEVLVRRERDRAYLIAFRLTGDPYEAQDCVQEAFVRAWKALPAFRGEAQFSTWLTRILINTCHNARRAAPAVPEILREDQLEAVPGVDQLVEDEQRRKAVRRAVLKLPFHQRAPLILHTFAGFSHAEAGRILGISESAAKVRVHRAQRALLDVLRDWR